MPFQFLFDKHIYNTISKPVTTIKTFLLCEVLTKRWVNYVIMPKYFG